MTKIKFSLVKLNKALVFQILDQGKLLPSTFEYKASNGIHIRSAYTHIDRIAEKNRIYLRSDMKDYSGDGYFNKISTAKFISNNMRDVYYEKILSALKEFSNTNI